MVRHSVSEIAALRCVTDALGPEHFTVLVHDRLDMAFIISRLLDTTYTSGLRKTLKVLTRLVRYLGGARDVLR